MALHKPRPSTPTRGAKASASAAVDPEIHYFHIAAVTDNSAETVVLPEAAE
jgi:hypothetical protein